MATRKAAQNKTEKQVIRKQTRKALSQGMTPGSRKGGLGITHNEGGKSLQNAVDTLGYKKSRRLVKRVVKNQSGAPKGVGGKKRA